jgi:hypothetical protein
MRTYLNRFTFYLLTGVYSANCKMNGTVCGIIEQTNLARFADLRQPDFYEKDIWTAIITACRTEGWRPTHTNDRRRQMFNE